jgi:hypothetical protein
MVNCERYRGWASTLPSAETKLSLPKLLDLTFASVSVVSFALRPSRALSKWYVVTSMPAAGGGALTVSASAAVCVMEEDVPVNVMVALPVMALPAAVKVTFCGAPGAKLKVVGFAVTPAGNPLMATLTVVLNPFCAVTLRATGWPAAPVVRVRDCGVTVKVKSG